jgi:hypothetical protein
MYLDLSILKRSLSIHRRYFEFFQLHFRHTIIKHTLDVVPHYGHDPCILLSDVGVRALVGQQDATRIGSLGFLTKRYHASLEWAAEYSVITRQYLTVLFCIWLVFVLVVLCQWKFERQMCH